MPSREGFLFLDMNSTDQPWLRKDEIIQLSAMKLFNNLVCCNYDGYACPSSRGQVEESRLNRKHGLQVRNGRLYRYDNQVIAPGQFHLSEQDLIEEFGNWISRRYDTGLATNNAFLSALFLGKEIFNSLNSSYRKGKSFL